jgi:Flp pilus assembly pilin Flp
MRAALAARRDTARSLGEQGASAVEYGLVVSLIAAVLVIGVFALGRLAGGSFASIDCWSSTGGSACAAAATSDVPAEPISVVAEPAPAAPSSAPSAPSAPSAAPSAAPSSAARPAGPSQVCNQSGNGNGKGQGQGSCK